MISLSVEPGIEPRTFRFQSKVLAGFLLHHFPLCVPPPLSSFSSSLFSLSLSLSLSASPFVPLPLFSCLSASLRETDRKTNKKKRVGFYSHHSTHNPFPHTKTTRGLPLLFPLEWAEGGLLKQRWVFFFSFTYRPTHRNGGVSSFGSDYCPARQTQTNPLLLRATVSLTFMFTAE